MLWSRDHDGRLAEVEADGQILRDRFGELAHVSVDLDGVTGWAVAVQEPSPGRLHQAADASGATRRMRSRANRREVLVCGV